MIRLVAFDSPVDGGGTFRGSLGSFYQHLCDMDASDGWQAFQCGPGTWTPGSECVWIQRYSAL